MLFRREQKERIRQGKLTSTFRKWKSPKAKPGGKYNLHPEGAIEVTLVEKCTPKSATMTALRSAGYRSKSELARALKCDANDDIYHVAFTYIGPDLVNQPTKHRLDRNELDELLERLQKMDQRSKQGPWTKDFLSLIGRRPATRAADLADTLGWQTAGFKEHVRRLKKLGLTNSLDVGYELSTRGKQVVGRLRR